jgi:hypothetical protein
MGVQRQNIMGCSALIQMGGQSFYAKDEIKVTPVIETFPITSSIHGKVGERKKSVSFKISFTPVGMWSTALLAVLHPNTNPTNGASIYGATDVPVVIHPVDGKEKITFSCGAITKSPGIKLTHDETLFKQCEIECILRMVRIGPRWMPSTRWRRPRRLPMRRSAWPASRLCPTPSHSRASAPLGCHLYHGRY